MITKLVTSAHRLESVEDKSVHVIGESSPYYHLRHYEGDQVTTWPRVVVANPFGGEPLITPEMECALGWEARPQEFLAHLLVCLREHRRVLRDDGILFFNLGDRWADAPHPEWHVKGKEALMLPQRLAMMAQADGWFVRHASIPWIKLNSLPNSNQDRLVTSHEDILMLTKSRDYFFNHGGIRRPPASYRRKGGKASYTAGGAVRHGKDTHTLHQMADERGRLCRTSDVWLESLDALLARLDDYSAQLRQIVATRSGAVTDDDNNLTGFLVNPQAYAGSHFAGWPERLVELLIRAGTSDVGVCATCGRQYTTPDVPPCTCGAGIVGAVVGDFFAGTAVTARVALRLRRRAIVADVSDYYLNTLATERLTGVQMEIF